MHWNARWGAWAAHHRGHVGIARALGYVGLGQPSPGRFLMGALIVAAGEAVRFWACGHLVRNERLTRTGPYRLVRHPLYLGSLLIGPGSALLTQVWWAWLAACARLYGACYLPARCSGDPRRQPTSAPSMAAEQVKPPLAGAPSGLGPGSSPRLRSLGRSDDPGALARR